MNKPIHTASFWKPFVDRLLRWYRQHGRHDLPFRQTRDPYQRWLAEVLLQQTRIEQGLKYWHACLKAFPTIEALVRAGRERLFQVCAGIGYYRRLSLFFDAASQVVKQGTQFPTTYEEWRALPGVGNYMAAILAATLHDEPYLPLDGNVRRVAARLLAYSKNVYTRRAEKEFEQLGKLFFQFARPSQIVEAFIDLGALVCRPRNAQCRVCPLMNACQAHRQGIQAQLPVRRTISRQKVQLHLAFCHDEQRFLVVQYREDELWAGLWGLPFIEELPSRQGRPWMRVRFDHLLTHRHVIFDVQWLQMPSAILESLTRAMRTKVQRAVQLVNLRPKYSRDADLPGMPAWMHRVLAYLSQAKDFHALFRVG